MADEADETKHQHDEPTVPELRLVGNHIPGSGVYSGFQGYGHLQFVYADEEGRETEIEVQSGRGSIFGNWDVPDVRDHTESTNYGIEGDYASTTILTGQAATEAFGILTQARDQFHAATERDPDAFDYDKDNNSNSFVRTLGDMIGVDLEDHLRNATPDSVGGGFPGSQRNVFSDPEENTDIINMRLHGYDGDNTIRTDLGQDILSGRDGRDDLSAGRNDDTLIAGRSLMDLPPDQAENFFSRKDGYSPYDDASIDWLRGGEGNDLYIVGAAAREDGQNEVIQMNEDGIPVVGENGAYYINPGLDIIDDADGQGRVHFSLDGYEASGRNHFGTFSGGDFREVPDADTVYPRYAGEGELDILHIENFSYQDQGGADVSGGLYVFIDNVNEHPVFAITEREGENFGITLQPAEEIAPEQIQGQIEPISIDRASPLREIVLQLDEDLPEVQERIAASAANGTLSLDEALVGKAISQTGTAQMFADLEAAGVTELDVEASDPADPLSRTQAAIGAAADAMYKNDLPTPETDYVPENDNTGVGNDVVEMAMSETGEAANHILQQELAQANLRQAELARAQETEADYDYAM